MVTKLSRLGVKVVVKVGFYLLCALIDALPMTWRGGAVCYHPLVDYNCLGKDAI